MKSMRILVGALSMAASLAAAPVLASDSGAQKVDISVTKAGFAPKNVTVKKGQPIELVVTRKTDQTCATEISLPEYGVKKALPLNKPVVIEITPKKSGAIAYACGMGMMTGQILVQ